MKREYLSFFSGALGLDLGLEAAGLRCLAANEIDPVASKTIRANKPNLKLFESDIRELTTAKLQFELDIKPERLFAIVGGPPCQAFSTAGRRLGLNDDRGNVFLHFVELIRSLRPKYAVFENVRGLLSAPLQHRPHSLRGNGFGELSDSEKPGGALLHILRMLEEDGYVTTFTLYNTANYGVPQNRERLIFFASRDGKGVPFIPPSHSAHPTDGLLPWKTVRETLTEIKGQKESYKNFPEGRLKYFKLLKQGQNWRDLPSSLQRKAMGKSWEAGGGKTGFYRRLSLDKPSPTLVTRPTMPATALCHPTRLRPLTVEEYSALQTFPPDFVFSGKIDDQYRQIGNAVPPLFAQAIGNHLIRFDLGKLPDIDLSARFSRYERTDHRSWRFDVERVRSPLLF